MRPAPSVQIRRRRTIAGTDSNTVTGAQPGKHTLNFEEMVQRVDPAVLEMAVGEVLQTLVEEQEAQKKEEAIRLNAEAAVSSNGLMVDFGKEDIATILETLTLLSIKVRALDSDVARIISDNEKRGPSAVPNDDNDGGGEPPSKHKKYATVLADSLAAYVKPTFKSKIVSGFKKGSVLVVLDKQQESKEGLWVSVRIPGSDDASQIGWVLAYDFESSTQTVESRRTLI